jgi:hypothetical protein
VKTSALREHFRQKQAKPRKRKEAKDHRGRILDHVSIDERPKIVEEKSRADETSLNRAALRAFKLIPAPMQNTLKLDNGRNSRRTRACPKLS